MEQDLLKLTKDWEEDDQQNGDHDDLPQKANTVGFKMWAQSFALLSVEKSSWLLAAIVVYREPERPEIFLKTSTHLFKS